MFMPVWEKHILVIEDDGAQLRIFQDTLQSAGYTVSTATSVQQGLELIKKSSPDFVLLDIMLPGGQNGFDFLQQMKLDPKTASIPVLVVTNLDTERDSAIAAGAVDYIVKANTPLSEMVTTIKKYLG